MKWGHPNALGIEPLVALVLAATCSACAGTHADPVVEQETTGMGGDKGVTTDESSTETAQSTTENDSSTDGESTSGAGGNPAAPTKRVTSPSFSSTKVCSGSLCVTANLVSLPPMCSGELCIRQGKF